MSTRPSPGRGLRNIGAECSGNGIGFATDHQVGYGQSAVAIPGIYSVGNQPEFRYPEQGGRCSGRTKRPPPR